MQNINELLDKIDVLPMSPSLLPKLLPYLGDVNGNFDKVVGLISLEQTLTAKLLQICNSAFFGLEAPVATVHEAVSQVGYQSVYLLTAMINGSNCFPHATVGGLDSGKLWKHSVATAFNSKFAAESAGLDCNLLLTAGLMHDIGKVILAQTTDNHGDLPFHHLATAETLAQEQLKFGCNHALVGATLLEKWNLPPQLVASVRYHHDPRNAQNFQKIAACVAIGDGLAHSLEQPESLKSASFNVAMEILQLDSSHLKRWNEQFTDSTELIAGMSQLPL